MKSKIPFICKKLSEKNLIAGSEGNVSEKKSDRILISPSQKNKAEIKSSELSWIDLQGRVLKGRPSSERNLHTAVYQAQKKAQVLIHAHPPSTIALSVARPDWNFLPPVLPEMIVMLGEVPLIPYVQPGTKKLGEAVKAFVKKYHTIILSHHGAIVWAEDLETAFLRMEQLEQCCKVLCLAESMGGAFRLKPQEIRKLKR